MTIDSLIKISHVFAKNMPTDNWEIFLIVTAILTAPSEDALSSMSRGPLDGVYCWLLHSSVFSFLFPQKSLIKCQIAHTIQQISSTAKSQEMEFNQSLIHRNLQITWAIFLKLFNGMAGSLEWKEVLTKTVARE